MNVLRTKGELIVSIGNDVVQNQVLPSYNRERENRPQLLIVCNISLPLLDSDRLRDMIAFDIFLFEFLQLY